MKTKRPKIHPADEFAAKVIADAVEWTAFVYPGRRISTRHASREKAREEASKMADKYKRPALVYAVTEKGQSALADTIKPSPRAA